MEDGEGGSDRGAGQDRDPWVSLSWVNLCWVRAVPVKQQDPFVAPARQPWLCHYEMTCPRLAWLLWTIPGTGGAAGRGGRVTRAGDTWLGAVLCLYSGVFPGAEGESTLG